MNTSLRLSCGSGLARARDNNVYYVEGGQADTDNVREETIITSFTN